MNEVQPVKRKRIWPWVLLGAFVLLIMIIPLANSGKSGTVSNTPPPVATPAAQPDNQVATFGQTFTWPDGIAVSVAAPKPYSPGAAAAGNTRGRAIAITTTITNGSQQLYQFNPFDVGPQVTQGGEAASTIIDIGNNMTDTAAATILPGKSFRYTTAYSVGPKGDLQVQYSEGYGGGQAIFTGQD